MEKSAYVTTANLYECNRKHILSAAYADASHRKTLFTAKLPGTYLPIESDALHDSVSSYFVLYTQIFRAYFF